uniref:Coatomer subunit zeta n=1 Tax=Oryctolagus cuniculus TaxID=9986 RepID=A0A5F9D9Y2_RABIT
MLASAWGKIEVLILGPSLYTVKAILILENDGDQLFAKYYDDTYFTVKEQNAFEKNSFNKTHQPDSETALLEGLTAPNAEGKCGKVSSAGEHGGTLPGSG